MDTTRKDRLRHYLNPLHVFCGMKRLFNKEYALKAARIYEKMLFRPLVTFFF